MKKPGPRSNGRGGKLQGPDGSYAAGPEPLFDRYTDDLLTAAEAARLLRISVSGIRRLQQRRLLPFIKVGGSLRFARRDLLAYVEKRRVASIG